MIKKIINNNPLKEFILIIPLVVLPTALLIIAELLFGDGSRNYSKLEIINNQYNIDSVVFEVENLHSPILKNNINHKLKIDDYSKFISCLENVIEPIGYTGRAYELSSKWVIYVTVYFKNHSPIYIQCYDVIDKHTNEPSGVYSINIRNVNTKFYHDTFHRSECFKEMTLNYMSDD
ncbi:hypothetical protein [Flammeovirga sp. SJP92]|uniref:hypothetical protein n=1 Tax=Flammeovirga sp. SJP92 TaxID=1775430 RepID=UPI00078826EB|nr:hypothetical protein [Flammeovirga sp. SJP92]KXX67325.1 hypothetical protein AVL50_28515 [Flammeovirga sp. SJP92]